MYPSFSLTIKQLRTCGSLFAETRYSTCFARGVLLIGVLHNCHHYGYGKKGMALIVDAVDDVKRRRFSRSSPSVFLCFG